MSDILGSITFNKQVDELLRCGECGRWYFREELSNPEIPDNKKDTILRLMKIVRYINREIHNLESE